MRTFRQILTPLVLTMTIVGCQDYLPLTGGVNDGSDKQPSSNHFNFSTVKEVTLDVDLGKRGSRAPIEIFTDDPTYIGEDGETYYKGEPEFAAFLDNNGRYKGTITLPAGADKVWVYSMRSDLPQMMPVKVSNGGITVANLNTRGSGDGTLSGTDADNVPYGYSPDAAEIDGNEETGAFKLIAESPNEDFKEGDPEVLKIWDTPKRDGATAGQNIYTIVNWAGQRFGRIIPTHYYLGTNEANVTRYELNEGAYKGKTYNNQNLINDLSDVTGGDGVTFGRDDIDVIQYFLWQGYDHKIENLKNHQYIDDKMTTEAVNTVIPKQYIDENGEHKDVEGAEIWLTLLGEGARFMDGIGYYYYPTGNPPMTTEELKNLNMYIAIPNASIPADGYNLQRVKPFRTNTTANGFEDIGGYEDGYYSYHPKFVPFGANQEIQLLYHDEKTGKVSKKFPPGLTVGYFITAVDANAGGSETAPLVCPVGTTYKINAETKSSKYMYSNVELNGLNNNPTLGQKRFLALNYNNVVVYGVEDGNNAQDTSLEDVLFTIRTNPEGIAANPDRFTINRTMEVAKVNHRTYAFEDIWPDGGDYDMNDVVIDHSHKMFIKRGTGDVDEDYVTRIEDVFEIAQPANAADYHDAFGFQIPKTRVDEGRYHVYWGNVRMGPVDENYSYVLKKDDKGNTTEPIEIHLGPKGTEAEQFLIKVDEKGNYDKEIFANEPFDANKGISWKELVNSGKYIEIDDETHITFILFPDVKQPYQNNKIVTVVREFDEPRLKVGETKLEVDGKNMLNPFIVSQSDKNIGPGRIEVHLPGHDPTGRADKRQFKEDGTPDPNAYYRQHDAIHPFAISISNSVITNEWGNHFTEPEGEGVIIEEAYPDYDEWATSKGEKNKDWYTNYNDPNSQKKE